MIASRAETAAPGETGRVSVLVADSQALFAQALGRALGRHADIAVLEPYARSGVEAVHAGVVLRPDVAVLDLWLEGISGPAATRTIIAKSPGTRVVVLGWFHGAGDISQALHAGAGGFVSKQLGLAAVLDAIRRVAAGQRVVTDPHYAVAREASDMSGPGEQAGNGDVGAALTPRELEVLRLLGAGLPVEDIAARLDITRETARSHLTAVLTKTGAHSQLQAVAVARGRGYFV